MESFQNTLELAWWVVIKTEQPSCTYYFGPFDSTCEAQLYQSDYIEDLVAEKPQEIYVETRYCLPNFLTLCKEEYLQTI
ncbi:DUF1816 domain-containing protein [Rivularia sp. UHCC 0363]|uniref:DUF1816 domain-containing protein n=1 Tax=Rivularia sp. UHCC 0363 TaxID=3110244 RepID=UPI002B21CE44|nr:DUF1816 domain-containing protein [Rivularia sp. UHCC 0363]MEA5594939.1 DUF1816 domain-containing protein [Rivularia sp. UHCC 0363]